MSFSYFAFRQRLQQAYLKQFSKLRIEHGLTQMEVELLQFLRHYPAENTATAFIRWSGTSKSQVSGAVEHLVQKGILSRKRSCQNRRLILLAINADYELLMEQIADCQDAFCATVLGAIPEVDRSRFFEILEIVDNEIEPESTGHTK